MSQARFTAMSQGLDELHATLERFWCLCDATPHAPPQGAWRHKFATAVGEIGGNIVRHAYADRPHGVIDLRLRLFCDHVAARFVDHGDPYTPRPLEHVAVPLPDTLHLPEGGRGLLVARAVLDVLHYRRTDSGVNIWRLVKWTVR